jgi:hypothetical protein
VVENLYRASQAGRPWPRDKWCVDVRLDSGESARFFEFNVRKLSLLELIAEAASD